MKPSWPYQSSELAGLKVLVVEADSDNRRLYTIVLEAVGAEVISTASARTAKAVLAEGMPDVLISDIVLPDENGYELLRQIRSLESSSSHFIPAIAVSGYVQGDDAALAQAAGFQQYLLKPIDLLQFVRTIARVVPHRTPKKD